MTARGESTSVDTELRNVLQIMFQGCGPAGWPGAPSRAPGSAGGPKAVSCGPRNLVWAELEYSGGRLPGGTARATGRRRQKSTGRRAEHGRLTTCGKRRRPSAGRRGPKGGADRPQRQRMAGEQKPSSNLLEQFILLAKGTSGSALTALISQVLEAPGVYVFGELLELANVQELAEGANAAYLQLLNLFAYGTYPDYIANKESLPELSTAQQNKLKHLTIVSLASRMKCIPYSVLLKDLEMRNLRELEDLIIEAVYTDIIQGKLDQRNQLLEVDFCIGRDIRKKDINNIVKTLHEWLPTSRRLSKPLHPPRPRRWSSSCLSGRVPLMPSRGSPPRRCPK
ncbi:COP9 signalosome complex subunit 7b isoform X3 [Ochotona princeps]|uniref:COP9 signalosome complex subunit 7b isoform X3 n=1 Tax=Ochotona princeps TaxID=9978 RepID=UPI00271468CD|nr:COP9 signalosome complex subunit 7b isoform X3 [Ochotona princeps]